MWNKKMALHFLYGALGGAIIYISALKILLNSFAPFSLLNMIVGGLLLYVGCAIALPEDKSDIVNSICAFGALLAFILTSLLF